MLNGEERREEIIKILENSTGPVSGTDLAKHFETKYSATLFVASKLKANYLTEGGAYHEGYSARSVDVHYCTDKKHADKIVSCIHYLLRNGGFE